MANDTTSNGSKNGKLNGTGHEGANGDLATFEKAKAIATQSGRFHVDEVIQATLVGSAVGRAGLRADAAIDPSDPADARLLEGARRADVRVEDLTQRLEHDLAALRVAEATRDAVGPSPVEPAAPWLIIAVLAAASAVIATITFHSAFGLTAYPSNPSKAMLFGLLFGTAVTSALVGSPFKAATYNRQAGFWRWVPLLAGTGLFGGALYLIRNAQSTSGHRVSLGLAIIEGVIVLIAECVAHAYSVAWDEYRTLAKAYAKAEGFVATERSHVEDSRRVLAEAESSREGIDLVISGRQTRARERDRTMACAGEDAAAAVVAAAEEVHGRVFGNTWRSPTEAEALERLGVKKPK